MGNMPFRCPGCSETRRFIFEPSEHSMAMYVTCKSCGRRWRSRSAKGRTFLLQAKQGALARGGKSFTMPNGTTIEFVPSDQVARGLTGVDGKPYEKTRAVIHGKARPVRRYRGQR